MTINSNTNVFEFECILKTLTNTWKYATWNCWPCSYLGNILCERHKTRFFYKCRTVKSANIVSMSSVWKVSILHKYWDNCTLSKKIFIRYCKVLKSDLLQKKSSFVGRQKKWHSPSLLNIIQAPTFQVCCSFWFVFLNNSTCVTCKTYPQTAISINWKKSILSYWLYLLPPHNSVQPRVVESGRHILRGLASETNRRQNPN